MAKNRINRTPIFAVGTRIKHPKHGVGIIKNIDNQPNPNYEFFYYVDFAIRKGDGTKIWIPKVWSEKNCEIIESTT